MTPEPAAPDAPNGPGSGPVPPFIEDACEEMIRRWGEGDRVPAEELLARCPAPAGPNDAFELAYLEYLLREAQGEEPLGDLAARFPALASRLDRQVSVHRAIQPDAVTPDAGVAGEPGGPRAPADGRPTPAGFEIIRELGRGGRGVVYLARQVGLDRPVALKMILAGPMALFPDHARFLAEGRAVARLQHPNIVQVHQVGEHDGQPFIAMEYVDGGSLADDLDGTPRPTRVVAATVRAVALGIAEAHRRGVIHRDLKPSNVLLRFDGTPKVADFGLAKFLDAEQGLTLTGALMGSPRYMAPEQAGLPPSAVGPAADVHAIGAIFYELLTGRPPFAAETPMATLELIRNSDPVPPKRLRPRLPRDVETICLTCLAKEPADRYPSAEALADDLKAWLDGRPIRARPLGAWGRSLRWARRHLAVAALLTAVIFLLAAMVTGMTVLRAWARDEARAKASSRFETQRLAAGQALDRGLAQAEAGDVARGLHSMAEPLRNGGGSDPDLDRAARAYVAARSALVLPPVGSYGGGPSGAAPGGRTVFMVEDGVDVRIIDQGSLRPAGGPERGHHSPVREKRYSADGATLDTAAEGGVVPHWDAATGAFAGPPLEHPGEVEEVVSPPDGRALLVFSYNRFWLWDLGPAAVADRSERLLAAAFRPDGSTFVSTDIGRRALR